MRAISAASNASREANDWCASTSVAMPSPWASASPPAPGLLLMTAATRTPSLSSQFSFLAVRAMAAMFEPPPEIRMTMFFMF